MVMFVITCLNIRYKYTAVDLSAQSNIIRKKYALCLVKKSTFTGLKGFL